MNGSNPADQIVVNNRFVLQTKVGNGSFGELYEGKDTKNGMTVAIKLEKTTISYPQLVIEHKIYSDLKGSKGIPQIKWFGKEGDFNVLVMDMLGPTLEDLHSFCKRKFGLKTICWLAIQLLTQIETVHSHNLIHRDLKPDNCLIGLEKNFNIVYLIDFGLAKRYIISKTGKHIPFVQGKSLTGTARFASLNTHLGYEQSRRDDLESLGYMLLYFAKGKLPWQGINAKTKEAKHARIRMLKQLTSVEELCSDLPPEFVEYLTYCRNLKFKDNPNYAFLRDLFRRVFKVNRFENDGRYEWVIKYCESQNSKTQAPSEVQFPSQCNMEFEIPQAQINNDKHLNGSCEDNDLKKTKKSASKKHQSAEKLLVYSR